MANALVTYSGFGGGPIEAYGDPATPFILARVIRSAPGRRISISWISAFGFLSLAPPVASTEKYIAPLQVYRMRFGVAQTDPSPPSPNVVATSAIPDFFIQESSVPSGVEEIFSGCIELEKTIPPFNFPDRSLYAENGDILMVCLGAATDRSPGMPGTSRAAAKLSLSVGGTDLPLMPDRSFPFQGRSLPSFDL